MRLRTIVFQLFVCKSFWSIAFLFLLIFKFTTLQPTTERNTMFMHDNHQLFGKYSCVFKNFMNMSTNTVVFHESGHPRRFSLDKFSPCLSQYEVDIHSSRKNHFVFIYSNTIERKREIRFPFSLFSSQSQIGYSII